MSRRWRASRNVWTSYSLFNVRVLYREDGLKFYRAVAKKWKRALKPGGKLAFEVGFDQAPAVEYILAEHGYQDIQTTLDPGMHWRVVEGSTGQIEFFGG